MMRVVATWTTMQAIVLFWQPWIQQTSTKGAVVALESNQLPITVRQAKKKPNSKMSLAFNSINYERTISSCRTN
ncbi:hypothetical protein VCRA2114E365_130125 [Vibrio crassostreae]|nr:hypothetical protein VCRA2115O371_120022 [Vibrio crassostreae]CAK1744517.1 hypothetical protein VCRA2114O367_130022 [Vibrio crassostreae]CAK1745212.1 hypothetical protein VCRA2113O354_130022 [Vibrio crassostreae]CAK1746115.1 hypothetical protein VCRA2117O376_130022 [Vibrio crassostreae]CAK1746515.1 hypothetical protein VCRA2113O199_130022 [Vibrio crassostreae]